MNKKWMPIVFILVFFMMGCLKSHEILHLNLFRKYQRPYNFYYLDKKESLLSTKEKEIYQIWKSILTGNTRKVSKVLKRSYSNLGMDHIFTPSGFHLSAVTAPLFKINFLKNFKVQFFTLLGILFFFIPGFFALKRMISIKLISQLTNLQLGFSFGMILDFTLGTFASSPISFTYSFLFLAIIYGQFSTTKTILLLFFAQTLIAFFTTQKISFLLLFWCPILNLIFGAIIPIIFFLSIPMLEWQLKLGIYILSCFNNAVIFADRTLKYFVFINVEIEILIILILIIYKKWRFLIFFTLFISHSLDPSSHNITWAGRYELDYSSNKCEGLLKSGYWKRNCSLKRGSKRIN